MKTNSPANVDLAQKTFSKSSDKRPVIIAGKLVFTDSLGVPHDLSKEKLLTTREASNRLKCGSESVLRKIRSGDIYPVLTFNSRSVRVYECAIDDYLVRNTSAASKPIVRARK